MSAVILGRLKRARGEWASARSTAVAVLLLLVAASILAFFYAQHLKHEPPWLLKTPPGVVTFAPHGAGDREAHFHIKISTSARVKVSIVRASTGRVVSVVVTHDLMHRYRTCRLIWDGKIPSGKYASVGSYLVRVQFDHGGPTVVVPYYELTIRGSS